MTATARGTLGWHHAYDDAAQAVFTIDGSDPFTITAPIARDAALIEAGLDFARHPTPPSASTIAASSPRAPARTGSTPGWTCGSGLGADGDNPGGVDSINPHGVQHDDVADLF